MWFGLTGIYFFFYLPVNEKAIGMKTGYGGGQVPSFPFPNHRSGSWANETL